MITIQKARIPIQKARTSHARINWLIAAAALAACDAAQPGTAQVSYRDSVGVQIVENDAALLHALPHWLLSDSALVSIGAATGTAEEQLHRVISVVHLRDGEIVVANAGGLDVRWFNAHGDPLLKVGRPGGGPGEFRALNALLALPGDSLAAFDNVLGRISMFDSRGTFVRSFGLPSVGDRRFPKPVGSFADGTLLALAEAGSAVTESGTVVRELGVYYRLTTDGIVTDTLGEFPTRGYATYPFRGGLMTLLLPFEPEPTAVAAGDRFYFGAARDFSIQVYSLNGKLTQIIRLLTSPRAITGAHMAAAEEERVARITSPDHRALIRRMFGDLRRSTMPAYGSFVVSTDGHMWVQEYAWPKEDSVDWVVFAPSGELIATARLPINVIVYRVAGDTLTVKAVDDLGVERIELRRVHLGPQRE